MVKPTHNLMAYNSQIAVDAKYKFIIATDVSNKKDYQLLSHMAYQTQKIVSNDSMKVIADEGYYSAKEIDECMNDTIDVINLIGITLFRELIRAIQNNDIEQIREKIALHIAYFYTTWLYFFKMLEFYGMRGEK